MVKMMKQCFSLVVLERWRLWRMPVPFLKSTCFYLRIWQHSCSYQSYNGQNGILILFDVCKLYQYKFCIGYNTYIAQFSYLKGIDNQIITIFSDVASNCIIFLEIRIAWIVLFVMNSSIILSYQTCTIYQIFGYSVYWSLALNSMEKSNCS